MALQRTSGVSPFRIYSPVTKSALDHGGRTRNGWIPDTPKIAMGQADISNHRVGYKMRGMAREVYEELYEQGWQ